MQSSRDFINTLIADSTEDDYRNINNHLHRSNGYGSHKDYMNRMASLWSIIESHRKLRLFAKYCDYDRGWSMSNLCGVVAQKNKWNAKYLEDIGALDSVIGFRVYWRKRTPIHDGYDVILDDSPMLELQFNDWVEQGDGEYLKAV